MKACKFKLVITIIFMILSLLTSCVVKDISAREDAYRMVMATEEELSEIVPRLDPILSMFHRDYNCEKDNIYEYMFQINMLDYVYPEYDEEVEKFIAEPYSVSDVGFMFWYESDIPQNDPLLKFGKIPEQVFNESGSVDTEVAYDYYTEQGAEWYEMIVGHNKFSGEYIDWLVEGVWNGKVDHDSFMEFEDKTRLYYHDGNYYTPWYLLDRGGGIFFSPAIDSITPLNDGRYEVLYTLYDEVDEKLSENKAVIGMKETPEGFRFWSIYSIDYDI